MATIDRPSSAVTFAGCARFRIVCGVRFRLSGPR